MKGLISTTMVLLVLVAAPAWPEEQAVLMLYHERAPYVVVDDNQDVQGLVGGPVRQAFEQASIALTWSEIPPNRQLMMLQTNKFPTCSLGWFKNAERERYAQFSESVYQDHPPIGIAIRTNANIADVSTISDLFQQDNLTLLTKVGYSYGDTIDKLITELEPNRLSVTVENTSMLKMLVAGRVDYFFIAYEEAEPLIVGQGLQVDDFKFVTLLDAPPGEHRYVICNQQVSTKTMANVNQWLTKQAQKE